MVMRMPTSFVERDTLGSTAAEPDRMCQDVLRRRWGRCVARKMTHDEDCRGVGARARLVRTAERGLQELPPIRNFLQVTPEFCTGGQPRIEHFAKLKADGVKAIMNLRQPGSIAPTKNGRGRKAGLSYFNIPVSVSDPQDAQVDEFLKLTDDPANRPMFIHCTAAIRVGAFWMIRRALRDGWTIEAAVKRQEGRPGHRAAPRGVRAGVHRAPQVGPRPSGLRATLPADRHSFSDGDGSGVLRA